MLQSKTNRECVFLILYKLNGFYSCVIDWPRHRRDGETVYISKYLVGTFYEEL